MADSDLLYLENLDEFINDENKIVTYKWLSNFLKVSSNKSKEMLQNFVENESKKEIQLSVTYLIGGKFLYQNNQLGYRYTIAEQSKIKETKEKFQNVTCCHIYSVQKSSLKDPQILFNVDVELLASSLHGLCKWSQIYCPTSKREGSSTNDSVIQPISNGFQERNSTIQASGNSNENKEQQQKCLPATKKTATTATSFFGSSTGSKESKKKLTESIKQQPIADKEPGEQDKKPMQKGKKEISFFGKPTKETLLPKAKPDVNEKKHGVVETVNLKSSEKDSKQKKKIEREEDEDMEIDVDDKNENKKVAKNKSKKTKRMEENLNDKDDANEPKRRKTTIQESDSEEDDFESFLKKTKSKDDDGFEDDKTSIKISQKKFSIQDEKKSKIAEKSEDKPRKKRQEEEYKDEKKQKSKRKRKSDDGDHTHEEKPQSEPQEEQVDVEKVKEPDNQPKQKRKIHKKVLRSKTFMNDEGYMVTEKVYESESATDESDNETSASNQKLDFVHRKSKDITEGNKKLKVETSKHKKQASLMSFFKKK